VVDESGEDYLFPAKYFQMVTLPPDANRLFRTSGRAARPRKAASKTRR